MQDFTKVIFPSYREHPIFCKIVFNGGRLSITGVVGPSIGGHCKGSCGQIVDEVERGCPQLGFESGVLERFCAIWREWHLNDMRAGNASQRAFLRGRRYKDYSEACELLAEVGLLVESGYRYGTAWLREEVPLEVVEFLRSLPDSPVVPAWV